LRNFFGSLTQKICLQKIFVLVKYFPSSKLKEIGPSLSKRKEILAFFILQNKKILRLYLYSLSNQISSSPLSHFLNSKTFRRMVEIKKGFEVQIIGF